MSLARSDGQGRSSLVLAIVFPAMIGAALALAYYGYQDTQNVSAIAEAAFKKEFASNAEKEANRLTAQLEQDLNTSVNEVIAAVERRAGDVAATAEERCPAQAELPPTVRAVGLYRAGLPICVSRRDPDDRSAAGLLLEMHRSVQKEPAPKGFRFEHRRVGRNAGSLELFAYGNEGAPDRLQQLVLLLDRAQIEAVPVASVVKKLAERYRVALLDERGAEVKSGAGEPPSLVDRFVHEVPFGRALFRYRVLMAPQKYDIRELEERKNRMRVLRPLLVILSTVILAGGLGIVLFAVMAERRASRLKSDFIANVSHELKTPLSLIRMFGEMVATGRHKGEEAAREYGGIITRESERLSHLIDNVLDFARLERGKASYDFAEGDIAALLERGLDICRYRLEKERMRLRMLVEPQLPAVRMDENALTLVVLNLVDNALKYAVEGGEVVVSLARSPGGVVLAVRDFGPGVTKDEQSRIFERFYRAANARERNVRGSGIGLALVRHIAEAHGGRVTVESPVVSAHPLGPGALFRVFLPAPVPEAAPRDTEPHEVVFHVAKP